MSTFLKKTNKHDTYTYCTKIIYTPTLYTQQTDKKQTFSVLTVHISNIITLHQ